jgi:hypothetical protein
MGKSYDDKDIEATAHDPTDHGIGEIKELKADKNQDAALEFLRDGGDVRPMSAADEKALLRKIDWRIMVSCLHVSVFVTTFMLTFLQPLMFGCYTLRMPSTSVCEPRSPVLLFFMSQS